MCAEFSEDQIGKRVVAQSDGVVGEVTDVRDGDIYVTTTADVDRDVVDHLGWAGTVNQESHRLNDRYVADISDSEILLRV